MTMPENINIFEHGYFPIRGSNESDRVRGAVYDQNISKIGTKVVYSFYFKNLVLATKKFKMAAKISKMAAKKLVFTHYFLNLKYF